MSEDFIFVCNKCGHNLYTDDVNKLIGYDCSECGEEFESEIWRLKGKGVFKKPGRILVK